MLTVLSVGYPFAPVTADPAGGAEQVLAQLDRTLTEVGHRSVVIAAEGSDVTGELHAVPTARRNLDEKEMARVEAMARAQVAEQLRRDRLDLVHYHGIDFDACRVETGVPQLATLHLPISWYAEAALRSGVRLLPVSRSQAAGAPARLPLLPPIGNGVDLDRYQPGNARLDYALVIGRVAPEKGFHDAIAAAKRAGAPLIAAGQLYSYPTHQRYFDEQVAPALDAGRRWIGPVSGEAKARLIAQARCLLVPSTAPETSSLVAMEALASGTPVIAYRSGALPEVVTDGLTGFIVDDMEGMADAIGRIGEIDPVACRAAAEARFSARRMGAEYLRLYEKLAA